MVLLAVVVVAVGPLLLARLPLEPLQVVIGIALLLFGLEWLRKGVLRLAGRRSPSNSFQEYLEEREALEAHGRVPAGQPDWPARVVAVQGRAARGRRGRADRRGARARGRTGWRPRWPGRRSPWR